MIHAQLPLRVPCYDLAPVTEPTLTKSDLVSGIPGFLDLTGEYFL